jgi:precorrin-6B methylase 2
MTKASEIAGELRKGERLYEVFKEASKIAAFFVDLEQKEAKLVASIASLEKEQEKVDKEIEESVDEANKLVSEAKERAAKADKAADAAKAEAAAIVVKAKADGEKLIQAANNEVLKVRAVIAGFKQEESAAKDAAKMAKDAYDEIVRLAAEKKAQLLKAFN